MKKIINIKNSAIYLIALFAVVAGNQAWSALGAPTNPGFDLLNKTGKPVTIRLINDDVLILPAPAQNAPKDKGTVVQPATTILGKTTTARNQSASIDISKGTILVIWDGLVNKSIWTQNVNHVRDSLGKHAYFDNTLIVPKPTRVYHFKPGKTIYVTLRPDGVLDPQTGTIWGLTGKTEAGYPQSNNIQKGDIIKYNDKAYNVQSGALE